MKKRIGLQIILFMAMQITVMAQAGGPAIGYFEGFSDIGLPELKGKVQYSEPGQEYRISGSGENMWFGSDSFAFLWKRMEGDYIIQAEMAFIGEGTDPHRKAGLMIRSGLAADAALVSCVIHGDGLTALQYRKTAGADMEELKFDISGPGVLQLEKKGDLYTVSVAYRGEFYMEQSLELVLEGPLEAGLFVT